MKLHKIRKKITYLAPFALVIFMAMTVQARPSCEQKFLSLAPLPITEAHREGIRAIKDQYGPQYLKYSSTSPEENQVWIDLAQSGSSDHLFFIVENSMLKRANDEIFAGDKDVVTILSNLHKYYFFQALKFFAPQGVSNSLASYSDFKVKSGVARVELEPETITEFEDAVFWSYRISMRRMRKTLDGIASGLFDDIGFSQWMNVGFGGLADEANLAVREVRRTGERWYTRFDDPQTQENLRSSLRLIEYNRMRLEMWALTHPEQAAPMFAIVDDQVYRDRLRLPEDEGFSLDEAYIPNQALFEILRKERTVDGLRQKIQDRFKVEMDDENLLHLVSYAEGIDLFSPALFIPERVSANLNEAEFGGITADFVGMGADNWFVVALAVAKRMNLDRNLLIKIRENEEHLTAEIRLKKNSLSRFLREWIADRFSLDASEVYCSGDDCVLWLKEHLPPHEWEEVYSFLLYNFAEETRSPYRIRFSSISDGFPAERRTQMATVGELLEKEMRLVLQSEFSFDEYKNILIGNILHSDYQLNSLIATRGNNRQKIIDILNDHKEELQVRIRQKTGINQIELGRIRVF